MQSLPAELLYMCSPATMSLAYAQLFLHPDTIHTICQSHFVLPKMLARDTASSVAAAQARMNGGTNIALSIKQAGQLLKGEDADAARIIVLLTDGRVDAFQGQHLHPVIVRVLYASHGSVAGLDCIAASVGVWLGEWKLEIACTSQSFVLSGQKEQSGL